MTEVLIFDFKQELIDWLHQTPQGSVSFGDRNFEYSEHIGVQKSIYCGTECIIIQTIGVRQEHRRQGVATEMITTVERIAQELGLEFVVIQSIMGNNMKKLALKLGYEEAQYYKTDYIKRFRV